MRATFRMEDQNISMIRGDTLSFGFELYEKTGAGELVIYSEDLDTAFLSCKKNYIDEIYVFQKSLGDGITKKETGKYVVRVAPEDTEDIEAGKYYYDLEIGVNNDKYTILKGVLEIEQDVTA